MTKLDLKRELRHLYAPSAKVVTEVDVPALRFLMVDGQGDPNTTPAYAEAVEALFSVSYAAKFMARRGAAAIDYAVMPLEGLWWAEDPAAFAANDRAQWRWTMMIVQPDVASDALLEAAIASVRDRKRLPALERLRLETFAEGRCAQLLHIGPFSEEGPNIARLHAHIAQRGQLRGRHHEIYLSDVRRADPTKWRTILRQPME